MSDEPGGRRRFATTQWSVVAAAVGRSAEADSALASLCESYWRPVYGYIRRTGASPDAARALKRGGGQSPLPLEFDDGERQYLIEPVDNETPETLYERRWAQTIMA